jgi:hypothetical protein
VSWSVSVPPGILDEFEARAGKAKEAVADQFELEEAQTAYEAAVAAVPSLAAAIGAGPSDEVSVQLAGHANAGNEPREGWSADTVYVSVSRIHRTADL